MRSTTACIVVFEIDNSPQKAHYSDSILPIEGISREKSEGHSSPLNHLNRTVTPRRPRNADLREREYLTPKEVDRLQDAARKRRVRKRRRRCLGT